MIGVAPRRFVGTKIALALDFWVPMMMQQQINAGPDRLSNRRSNFFDMIARLKPGVSLEQAEAAYDDDLASFKRNVSDGARRARARQRRRRA
ncbi:MAG: hypothetical protein WKF84_09550 [Pyrinomonadaceae bacterium]